jgi:hypothetical protein
MLGRKKVSSLNVGGIRKDSYNVVGKKGRTHSKMQGSKAIFKQKCREKRRFDPVKLGKGKILRTM